MTKKARNTVSAKAGINLVLHDEHARGLPLTATSIDTETRPTALGLKIESPKQLAYAKEQLENALMDWALFSQNLIGPSATKALLHDVAKRIFVKGGRPKKQFDLDAHVKTLESGHNKSTKSVSDEGIPKHNIEKTRKARQRAGNEAIKINDDISGLLRTAAIELGYISRDAGWRELRIALEGDTESAAALKRALQAPDKNTSDH